MNERAQVSEWNDEVKCSECECFFLVDHDRVTTPAVCPDCLRGVRFS